MHSNKVFALSTGLALAATMMVSASAVVPTSTSNRSVSNFSQLSTTATSTFREAQPKDDRGKGGKRGEAQPHKLVASGGSKPCQLYYGCVPTPTPAPGGGGKKSGEGSGHKFAIQIAREGEPRDDRGHDRNDRDRHDRDRDRVGHKFVEVAREAQPKDDRGKGGKVGEGKAHKFAVEVAREREPRDDRGRDKRDHDKHDDHGHDGAGHKLVEWAV